MLGIGQGKILLSTNEREWTLACSKKSPIHVEQCKFCIVDLQCSCALRSKYYLIPPSLENCVDTESTSIIEYPLNILQLSETLENFEPITINGTLEYSSTDKSELSEINIKELDTENIVSVDEAKAIDLRKRVALARQNKDIYLSKADMGSDSDSITMGLLSSNYGDVYGLVTIILQTSCLAAGAAGAYLFTKQRQMAAILSLVQGSEAALLLGRTRDHIPTRDHCPEIISHVIRNLVYALLIVGTLLAVLSVSKYLFKRIYQHLTERRHLQFADSVPQKHVITSKVYLEIRGKFDSIMIFVANIRVPPTRLMMSRPERPIKIKTNSGVCGLRTLKVNWQGAKLTNTRSNAIIEFPRILTVPYPERNVVSALIHWSAVSLVTGKLCKLLSIWII